MYQMTSDAGSCQPKYGNLWELEAHSDRALILGVRSVKEKTSPYYASSIAPERLPETEAEDRLRQVLADEAAGVVRNAVKRWSKRLRCKSASRLTPNRLPRLTPPQALEDVASARKIDGRPGSRLGAERGQY